MNIAGTIEYLSAGLSPVTDEHLTEARLAVSDMAEIPYNRLNKYKASTFPAALMPRLEELVSRRKSGEPLSVKVGKSRSHITNILGLIRLPKEVQSMIAKQEISMGHARILSKLNDEEKIKDLANRITNEKLSVREIEELSNENHLERKVKIERKPKESTQDYKYVEEILRDKLDTKVKIKDKRIEISFTSVADLNRILEIINERN